MKIVQVHNYYQQAGGEDIVVAEEKALLEEYGHTVISYHQHNQIIETYSSFQKLKLFANLHFNSNSYKNCLEFLKQHQPDICHVHNTLHIISPAIFKACKQLNIPVVQTLHNYRSICVNGMLTKNEAPCTDCLGKTAYQSVKNKCYRNSYLQSFALSRMIEKSKKSGLYQNDVDAFICFTDFAKNMFITQGIPSTKIHLKANFTKPITRQNKPKKDYLIFVGRLDKTKGAHLLPAIASNVEIPIYVIGEGPLKNELKLVKNIKLLGKMERVETFAYIEDARGLLQLSTVYEGMPLTIIEAFAHKTPVIASNLGAMAAMITNQKNGLLFKANDSIDAITKTKHLLDNHTLQKDLAEAGYRIYESEYNAQVNYFKLMDIYKSVQKT
jgi:glycosyltransferase involved in cell wall biosynthesis